MSMSGGSVVYPCAPLNTATYKHLIYSKYREAKERESRADRESEDRRLEGERESCRGGWIMYRTPVIIWKIRPGRANRTPA